jgi:hypothetical protein
MSKEIEIAVKREETCKEEKMMDGNKPATEKQKRFAQWISNTLEIPMPKHDSCVEYSHWISAHINDFKRVRDEAEALADLAADWDGGEADYYFDECMR